MWTFESSTGKWFNPAGQFVVKGYAGGNCGKNPEGINNPSMQNVHNIGPLPEGMYTLGKLLLESHLGKYAIELLPDADNQMFGRADFYCHGDTDPAGRASEGCIILPHDNRVALWTSSDKRVKVVAHYVAA
jgi:Protein of unknown function (DUF2778)